VSRKWTTFLGIARKKRTEARKKARGTGGGEAAPLLDSIYELVLSVSESNTDLFSDYDCEAARAAVQVRAANHARWDLIGKFYLMYTNVRLLINSLINRGQFSISFSL
jgi:hypothetical protein